MDPSRNGPWLARLVRAAFTLDARSLALYRIALGLIVCADVLGRAADFDLMFAVDGVFPPDVVRRELGRPTAWPSAWLHDVQRRGDAAAGECEHIAASWPARTPAGGGNLDRFLQATAPQPSATDDLR